MASSMTGFAARYASALFEIADEHGNVDAVAKDLDVLSRLIDESEDLSRLVYSPAIGRSGQAKAIDAVLKASKADSLVRKFVGVVAANGRLFALKAIIARFLADLAARRGEISAEVVSAIPLDNSLEGDIRKMVTSMSGSDKVSLAMRVDPSMIGGLIVRVGSRMIDSSIRSKLNRLETTMKGIG